MSLQDYFPISLAQLIRQVTVIKPKVVQSSGYTYILTAKGQVLRSLNNADDAKFIPFYTEPVQDIVVDPLYHNAILITLDAKILYFDQDQSAGYLDIDDVISIATHSENITAVTITGNFYIYDKDKFKLVFIAEPVVMTKEVSSEEFLLLRMDGRVWRYDMNEGLISLDNVENVIALSSHVLLRVDRRVYELDIHEFDIQNIYKLNQQVSNVTSMGSFSDGLGFTIINLVARSGQILRKVLTEIDYKVNKSSNWYQYKTIMVSGAVIAIAGTVAILASGQVVQSQVVRNKYVMITIPRLNIFTHHK